MRNALTSLFRRSQRRRAPIRSFADRIRQTVVLAPSAEGGKDRLLEHRLTTFGDDMVVKIYAGDIRLALQAARGDTTVVHPDRFRLDYDWGTGRLSADDGRARFGPIEGAGWLQTAGYVLRRIREDDLRERRPNEAAERGRICCRAANIRGFPCPICDPD